MIRHLALPLACGFALLSVAAQAQVAGVYEGVSADNHDVKITVVGNDLDGYSVTDTSVGFAATCTDGTVLDTGWGYNSGNANVRKGKLKTTTAGAYFTISLNLVFSSDNGSATGTVTTYSPSLRPIGDRPNKSTFCTSPTQPVNLLLQPSETPTAGYPKGGAVMLGKTYRSPDPVD